MQKRTLSHEQARFYRDQGFYRLTGVYDADETDAMRHFIQVEADQTGNDANPLNPNKKLYGLYDRDPLLMRRVVGHQALVDPLQSLLGPRSQYCIR